jgi:hypothetical protein
LCRECHVSFHNIKFYQINPGRPGGTRVRSPIMMGGACINCHKNIHGSNALNVNSAQYFFR